MLSAEAFAVYWSGKSKKRSDGLKMENDPQEVREKLKPHVVQEGNQGSCLTLTAQGAHCPALVSLTCLSCCSSASILSPQLWATVPKGLP